MWSKESVCNGFESVNRHSYREGYDIWVNFVIFYVIFVGLYSIKLFALYVIYVKFPN